MKKSDLKVIISNCLSGGTAWNTIETTLTKELFQKLSNVSGLEFKSINSNSVRGDHNSFTLVLTSVFYNLSSLPTHLEAANLLEFVRNAINKIENLTYSEIRIQHTRHFSEFNDFEHQGLAKMV